MVTIHSEYILRVYSSRLASSVVYSCPASSASRVGVRKACAESSSAHCRWMRRRSDLAQSAAPA